MNELTIRGTQSFMGKEIPVVLGGFGQDKKCISDKTIAEIHGMEIKHVRELINRSISRFREGTDYVDLKGVVQNDTLILLKSMRYSQQYYRHYNGRAHCGRLHHCRHHERQHHPGRRFAEPEWHVAV